MIREGETGDGHDRTLDAGRSLAFDLLGAGAVVLDPLGTILDTNDAWRRFAHLNGASEAATGPGADYLAICDRSAANGSADARAVAIGLRAVLAGELEFFDFTYACPAPAETCWFDLQASAAPTAGGRGIVLFHVPQVEVRHPASPDAPLPMPITSSSGGFSWSAHQLALLESLAEGVLVQDIHGRLLYANRGARGLIPHPENTSTLADLGWTAVEADGSPIEPSQMPGRRALSTGQPVEDVVIGIRANGESLRWLAVSSRPMLGPDDQEPYAVVSTLRDVTAQRTADDLLVQKAQLLDSVGQAVVAWDNDLRVTFVNTKAEQLFGWNRETVIGQPIIDLAGVITTDGQMKSLTRALAAGGAWEGELEITHPDGRPPLPVWTTNTPVKAGSATVGYVGVSIDLTDRKAADAYIEHQASHDQLTDLPNRQRLSETIDRWFAESGHHPLRLSIVLIDLGDAAIATDALGHSAADLVVVASAALVRDEMHPGDLLSKFADQMFVICCPHAPGAASAGAYAEHLRTRLEEPIRLTGVDVQLQPSAAVAVAGPDADTAELLLQRAHTALLSARPAKTTRVYDQSMSDSIRRQAHLVKVIDQTIERDSVNLGYQPIVRLQDQLTVGAEALLRIQDEHGEAISPIEIVATAERTGQIAELGDLILRTACAAAVRWQEIAPDRPLQVSVNVSARQLDDPHLADRVQAALASTGLDASVLCLEITESALMTDPGRSAARLGALRASGIKLAADDFGTGYSSLAYLKALPLDMIKIDQSFVTGLPANFEDVAITRAIMAMSDALGLAVTAEGVETEAQLGALLELGTGYGQGFLWGRAVAASDFEARLATEADGPSPLARQTPSPWRIHRPSGSSEDRVDSILNVLAHEIRTPLTVVTGYASLLESAADPAEAEAAAAIGRAASRINRILTNMVDLSTADDQADAADLEDLDAAAMLDDIVHDLAPGNVLHLHPPAGAVDPPAHVSVDVVQIQQVVSNLVSNATRFSPPGAGIDVGVTTVDGWVEIFVSDDGPGIDPDALALIFRKYGRIDPSGSGTGLGLYVARRIARSHGGDILYRRRTDDDGGDGGSTFILRLPRSAPVLTA